MTDIVIAAAKVSDLLVASRNANGLLTSQKERYMRFLGYEPTDAIMARSVREMTESACLEKKKTPEQCIAAARLIFDE